MTFLSPVMHWSKKYLNIYWLWGNLHYKLYFSVLNWIHVGLLTHIYTNLWFLLFTNFLLWICIIYCFSLHSWCFDYWWALFCSQSIGVISARPLWQDIWYNSSEGNENNEFFTSVRSLILCFKGFSFLRGWSFADDQAA